MGHSLPKVGGGELNGIIEKPLPLSSIMDSMSSIKLCTSKQATLCDYSPVSSYVL